MTGRARYDVVAIGASAGGSDALQTLLGGLTAPLPVPVLVAVHLGPTVSRLDEVLSRVSPMPVEWLADGVAPGPGRVYLCPGRSFVSLEPDGTCTVTRFRSTSLGVVDRLFESAAGSVGGRLLAVVLTGGGQDGAAGARAVKLAGGAVLIQNEATATAFGMGGAVLDAGDADLVLPLGELAEVLEQVVDRGRPLPTPARQAVDAMFAAGGDIGRVLAGKDWDATSLGPVEGWSPTLRSVLSMVLTHALPMNLLWGPERLQLYNDACVDLLAGHPGALGRPMSRTSPEVAAELEPMLREVDRTGRALLTRDRPFVLRRTGRPEETFVTFCYSPVLDDGRPVAVLGTALDTTSRVLADRRLAVLHRLATMTVGENTTQSEVCADAIRILAQCPRDVPFALLYLVDAAGAAGLSATTGLAGSSPALVTTLNAAQAARWPVHATLDRGEPRIVEDLQARFPGLAAGPWPEPPETALILPVGAGEGGGPSAVLIAGVSSNSGLDADYRGFFDLVAQQIGASLAAARGRRDARERIIALADLERSRTAFLAGVSHRFRTPLTQILLPLEEIIDELGHSAPAEPARLAHRNALRLLRLVDSLLTLAEAGPGQTRPPLREVDDLADRTAEIAGVFRSAVERAGLRLDVDCPALDRPVCLDPDMWETVVLNLVSNALKHTFTGGISVRLAGRPQHVELIVADTGIGIPPDEIPRVFTRFHRIRDARARSYEGSGIGLALVQQLVRQHRGSIRVRSNPGEGTTFTVWVPYTQLADSGAAGQTGDGTATRNRRAFADEADRWIIGDVLPARPAEIAGPGPAAPGGRAVILVVEDSADMRRYLGRLLGARYEVETAADGAEAIRILAERDEAVDLVISDVMMPEPDGLELLRHIRADPGLRATPVMLLTAPAGAEATMRALAAGAHDYVVKPFTARELIARIESQLALARLRLDAGPV
ncbi:MAG TPA: chemotaxis protein CheB [Actinoplanes sp.]|jgi:signal transduction histidine kinase/chemotaxis response regulator CheB